MNVISFPLEVFAVFLATELVLCFYILFNFIYIHWYHIFHTNASLICTLEYLSAYCNACDQQFIVIGHLYWYICTDKKYDVLICCAVIWRLFAWRHIAITGLNKWLAIYLSKISYVLTKNMFGNQTYKISPTSTKPRNNKLINFCLLCVINIVNWAYIFIVYD